MYDIEIRLKGSQFDWVIENNTIATVNGFQTLILTSLFKNKRASNDLIADPFYQGGHPSSVFDTNGSTGSLLWLYINKGKIDLQTIQNIKTTCNTALQWMIQENIVKDIDITIDVVNNGININISLYANNSDNKESYTIFVNTFTN
jgi:phage gp46-like protein